MKTGGLRQFLGVFPVFVAKSGMSRNNYHGNNLLFLTSADKPINFAAQSKKQNCINLKT
jgi:hypothetical protein